MPSVRDTMIFFTIGCALSGIGLWLIRWRLRARSWQVVAGRLLNKEIQSVDTSGDVSHVTVARYQYRVGGRDFIGERLRFDGQGGSKHTTAEVLFRRLPGVGEAVDVWFDPAEPERAVLDPTLRWSTYLVAALGAIFVLGSLAPWIIRALRPGP